MDGSIVSGTSASSEVPMKRDAGEHDELRRRVEAIDVGGRVGFRVSQSLRVGEHDVHRLAASPTCG